MKRKRWISLLLVFTLVLSSIIIPAKKAEANEFPSSNVALGKKVQASSVEEEMPQNLPSLVVDGDKESDTSRWSSERMKENGATDADGQKPQWLVIDLQAEETQVDSMSIYFYKKVWASKYQIQTADTNTADTDWETVKEFERTGGSVEDEYVEEISDVKTLKRYVRFYFDKVNVNAGGTGVSVREIEINGTQLVSGNLALGKDVQVSSIEAAMPQNEGRLVVDGIHDSDTSRWSSERMKPNGATEETEQTPQWLTIDLKADRTVVENINLYFHLKVWPTKYQIQTADNNTADTQWETVKTIERESGSLPDSPVDTFNDVTELKRYVRFYFEKINVRAGGTGVSVREIEINGTQPFVPEEPEETLAYSRDFNDGDVSAFSALYGNGANITAENGAMKLSYNTNRTGVVDKTIPHMVADGTFEATVIPQQAGKRFGLIMRATDENHKLYIGCENSSNKWFWEYWNGSNKWGSLHNGPALEQGQAAHIKVKFLGKNVTLWVNDQLVFQEEMTGTPLVSAGYFGFDKSQGAGTFLIDDVKVTEQLDFASGIMADITQLPALSAEDTKIPLPEVPEGYEIAVIGSEKEHIVSNDGTITSRNIGNKTFSIIVEVKNTQDETDKARKNFTVTVPSKNGLYPDLYPGVERPNEKPDVIPTLQEWYGYEGTFTLTEDSRIIIQDTANVDLEAVAKNMQTDLDEFADVKPEILEGTADMAGAGDIYIESQAEDVYETGEEGYFMTVDEGGVRIYSSTYTGALYGTITAEQILWQDEGNDNIPNGVIRDYPDYQIRSMMFDVGRIPHRLQYLEDYTKILTWYKMNEFQLHLNDDFEYSPEGLPTNWDTWNGMHRLESDAFPSLTENRVYQGEKFEYFNEEYADPVYTKEDYKHLEELANAGGIELIPEIDTPSHSNAYIRYAKENPDNISWLGEIQSGDDPQMLALDINSSDPEEKQKAITARKFMETLYEDYLGGDDPVFRGDTVNIGVDEYWDKSNPEAFRSYIVFLDELMQKYGKTTRMWGSLKGFPGNTEISPENIILDEWATYEDDPLARMKEGFRVVNFPQPYLYTTPGRDHKDMIGEEWLFKNWDPTIFNGNIRADKGEPLLLGAKASIWGDEFREGMTEADTHERALRSVAMVAEKSWGGTAEDDTYIEYQQKFDRLQEGPGTQIAMNIESTTDVVADYDMSQAEEADGTITVKDGSGNGYDAQVENGELTEVDGQTMIAFDGDTVMTTPLQTLAYPYTISFDIKAGEGNTKDSLLFSGYDGQLLAEGFNGSLSLNRSFYHQSFGYTIPKDESVNITIVGTMQNTKLYVNGELVKMLYSSDTGQEDEYFSTFVFPMETIGKNYHGYIGNIKAYNKALMPHMLRADTSKVTEVNVALNRNAYAERFGNTPDLNSGLLKRHPSWKATDGDKTDSKADITSTDPNSYWISSNNDKDYLMVDLGEERAVSKVVLNWEGNRMAADYEIQISVDGTQWQTVGGEQGNTKAVSTITFSEPVNARYVKMQGIRRNADYYAVREMEVYENVDKSQLVSLLGEVNAVIEEDKLADSDKAEAKALVEQAYAASRTLENATATQDLITAACETLNAAFDAYKENPEEPEEPSEISTAVLEYAIELAKTANTDGVIGSVKENFDKALANAETVLAGAKANDPEITQEVVDQAWKDLIKAMQYLEFKQGDKTDLGKVIELAKTMESDLDSYLDEGKDAFKNALAAAEAVYADQDAFQNEVDKSWKDLMDAMAGLMRKPDKDALKDLVAEAEGLSKDSYEAEGFAQMRTALAEAKAVLENDQATKEEVSAAETSLKQAMDRLAVKADGKGGVQSTGTAKGNAEQADQQNKADNNKQTGKNNTVKSAKTADSMNAMIAVAVMLAAMAAMAMALEKRKRK